MTDFRVLVLRHAGRAIWVLGGGPSLQQALPLIPDQALTLSANDHGCRARPCDFIVAMDDIEPRLAPYRVPVISTKPWAQYRVSEHPRLDYSGQYALWLAWLMGGHPVVLAGMDLYTGGTYWDDPAAPTSGRIRPFESHLDSWRRALAAVPGLVRAVGGPLVEHGLVPDYDPAESWPAYVPPARATALAACAGVLVRFTHDVKLHGYQYRRDEVAEIPRQDARRLLVQRQAVLSQRMP